MKHTPIWLHDFEKAFEIESETSLAYIEGRYKRPYQIPEKTYHHILRFIFFVLKNIKINYSKSKDCSYNIDFFCYAGTKNQYASLSTMMSDIKKSSNTIFLLSREVHDRHRDIRFSFKEVFQAGVLFFARFNSLRRSLTLENKANNLYAYMQSYIWMPFFYNKLVLYKPKFVLVSNDHSVSNRCLLAVAHLLQIETVYLQHGGVSNRFPPLAVNYAFLDGVRSLDSYINCEEKINKLSNYYPTPVIYINGQKKIIKNTKSEKLIGIAINPEDSVSDVLNLIELFLINQICLNVRFHPSYKKTYIDTIRNNFTNNNSLIFSDAGIENVDEFLGKCKLLISGNSSIHVEAALLMPTIYFVLTKNELYDYYQHVSSGLSQLAKNSSDLIELCKGGIKVSKQRKNIIKSFSASYMGNWYGKEGLLASKTLLRILDNRKLDDIYVDISKQYVDKKVYLVR